MAKAKSESPPPAGDWAVVVLDRGFVYCGWANLDGDWLTLTDASNIRYWGTTRGLGQLVMEGPTAHTKIDVCGTVRAPLRAVISIHPTEAALWKR